jgi:putative copper resistance protein D
VADFLIAARFVHFASCMVLFGEAFFPIYAGPADQNEPQEGRRRTAPAAAALLALLSGLAWLVAIVAGATGDWRDVFDSDALNDVLSGDAFGRLFVWRMALILGLLALIGWRLPLRSAAARAAMLILATILLGSLAFTGHGSTPKTSLPGLHRVVQFAHLLAGGAWFGGLWPLAASLGAARRAAAAAALRQAQKTVWRFSSMGSSAVIVILVTGIANSAFLVGKPAGLLATAYGQVLLAKAALVLGMIGVAAYNKIVLTPRLEGDDPLALAGLGRSVVAEQALGFCVLAAAAVLGTLVPAVFG